MYNHNPADNHDCGGTILSATDYDYCQRCHAFLYDCDADGTFPTGTHDGRNTEAADSMETRSPDADEVAEAAWDKEHADASTDEE